MAIIISGIVHDEFDDPVARVVRLLLSDVGTFVAETTSNAGTGAYEFTGLDIGELYDAYCIFSDFNPGGALIFTNIVPHNTVAGGAHRYWRLTAITGATGGDGGATGYVQLTELALFVDGVNVTSDPVTGVSVSASPGSNINGANPFNLIDADLSGGQEYWTPVQVPSLTITFDLGSGNDAAVNGVKQGFLSNVNGWIEAFTLEFSDDATAWTTLGSASGLAYGADDTYSTLYSIP